MDFRGPTHIDHVKFLARNRGKAGIRSVHLWDPSEKTLVPVADPSVEFALPKLTARTLRVDAMPTATLRECLKRDLLGFALSQQIKSTVHALLQEISTKG